MSEYIDVDDDNFYRFINKKYRHYKIPSTKKTLKQICFPKKYEFQIPQKFLAEFINPKTPYKGLLVFHQIGAGKTCAAVNIAEKFKGIKNIMVVLPASLKGNFRSELRSPCAGNNYLTAKERELLKKYHPSSPEYRDIIAISDGRINKFYQIYSYNKFVDLLKFGELSLDNTLLIIDEVHNMISETGIYYQTLYEAVHSAPDDFRMVIMSATPIFDKPAEIALTMNLLLRDRQLPTGHEFISTFIDITYTDKGPHYEVKNMDLFKDYIKGYVSYYRGAPPHVFPRSEINFVKVKMSEKQYKLYNQVMREEAKKTGFIDYVNSDIPNNFFIGTRMISNFTFPNNRIGLEGYESLVDDDFEPESLAQLSPKFIRILRKIKRAQGTVFVYSNFKEFGGIRTFVRMLEYYGYKNYEYHGTGKKRFAIWSGDQKFSYKEEVKAVFNNKDNEDGSKIKIILASPAAKEGISFLRVQQVHLLDPYWNWSKNFQIIGRAIRFCSHKDVPYEKQFVRVYFYLAVDPRLKMSVDQYIMKMAFDKQSIGLKFQKAMKEAAIDCELFKNANVYPGEEDIICDT
jgi:hypothetical protein